MVCFEQVKALFRNQFFPNLLTSCIHTHQINISILLSTLCRDRETEAQRNTFGRQIDERARNSYSLHVTHKPQGLLPTILSFAINICASL